MLYTSGVLQGYVLDPFLFLITHCQVPLNDGTSMALYADDLLLYRGIEKFNVSYYLLQEDIHCTFSGDLDSDLQLNASKRKYM